MYSNEEIDYILQQQCDPDTTGCIVCEFRISKCFCGAYDEEEPHERFAEAGKEVGND